MVVVIGSATGPVLVRLRAAGYFVQVYRGAQLWDRSRINRVGRWWWMILLKSLDFGRRWGRGITELKETRKSWQWSTRAKPTVSPVAKIVFCLFCLVRFEKWGRTDGRTEDMCENNDPYRPWLWAGQVDQQEMCHQWSPRPDPQSY